MHPNFDPEARTIFEPFRVKMIEPLPLPSREEREQAIRKANFNLFTLPAEQVTFDFLTDSGTSAMSADQWAAMLIGDESYAGSKSFYRFEAAVQKLTGLEFAIPTHQGRSAEALLAKALVKPGQTVPGNTHFDTTRANIEAAGAVALDLPCLENQESAANFPFKGNVDVERLRVVLRETKPPFFVMTVTNNSVGGQPVSMANVIETKKLLASYGVPMVIDAARFAENCYFIQQRESGYANDSVREIAKKLFSYADAVVMSAKKDALVNTGGFIALSDSTLATEIRQLMVLTEGFPTYGGLAGRDMEALAVGLEEILDESYLRYRIRSVEYFGAGIEACGLQVVKPFGGHAVYIDAGKSLPHITSLEYPGQSLSVELYRRIGLRGVEVGSVMLGHRDPVTGKETAAPKELVRLALPRRVYTQSHIDYILEKIKNMKPSLESLKGYRITEQSQFLRHFTAKFAPL